MKMYWYTLHICVRHSCHTIFSFTELFCLIQLNTSNVPFSKWFYCETMYFFTHRNYCSSYKHFYLLFTLAFSYILSSIWVCLFIYIWTCICPFSLIFRALYTYTRSFYIFPPFTQNKFNYLFITSFILLPFLKCICINIPYCFDILFFMSIYKDIF